MRLQSVLLVSLIWLTGCGEDPLLSMGCEITYHVDQTGTYELAREWRLIGFQKNGSIDIAYPPCEAFSGSTRRNDITVAFSDTLHNLSRNLYQHPYIAVGRGPVNDFSTSYQTEEGGRIMTSLIISTLIGSNDALINYEKQYFRALSRAERFEINYNLLTLYDDLGDKALFVAMDSP